MKSAVYCQRSLEERRWRREERICRGRSSLRPPAEERTRPWWVRTASDKGERCSSCRTYSDASGVSWRSRVDILCLNNDHSHTKSLAVHWARLSMPMESNKDSILNAFLSGFEFCSINLVYSGTKYHGPQFSALNLGSDASTINASN